MEVLEVPEVSNVRFWTTWRSGGVASWGGLGGIGGVFPGGLGVKVSEACEVLESLWTIRGVLEVKTHDLLEGLEGSAGLGGISDVCEELEVFFWPPDSST